MDVELVCICTKKEGSDNNVVKHTRLKILDFPLQIELC